MYFALSLLIIILMLLIFVLILICPSDIKFDSIKDFIGRTYAHRGLHDDKIPENSITAFQHAIDKGYGFELDVRFTKDKKAVVFHDDNLLRICGCGIAVNSLTYEELSDYKLCDTNEHVPLFSDVLKLVDGKQPIIVEIKACDEYAELCSEVISILTSYKGKYCIQSFDPRILRLIKKTSPSIIRGQLSYKLDKNALTPFMRFMLQNLFINIISKPHFISYRYEDSHNLFFRAATVFLHGYSAIWTIINPEMLNKAAASQNEMVIFEGFEPDNYIDYGD